MEQWWSGTSRRTTRLRKEICLSATFYTSSPTWAGLGSNLGLRDERPATDRLIHGAAETIGRFVLNENRSKIIAGPVRNNVAATDSVQRVTAIRGAFTETKRAATPGRPTAHDRLSVHSFYEVCAQSMW
jgi:hypothetical protein